MERRKIELIESVRGSKPLSSLREIEVETDPKTEMKFRAEFYKGYYPSQEKKTRIVKAEGYTEAFSKACRMAKKIGADWFFSGRIHEIRNEKWRAQ